MKHYATFCYNPVETTGRKKAAGQFRLPLALYERPEIQTLFALFTRILATPIASNTLMIPPAKI